MVALRAVLIATGGHAKVRELYQLLSAEETAAFLGLSLDTVRHLTARRELPCIKTGKRGVGYRVIDLIAWQEARLHL
jgi:excisionase family DNA binding protein